jgi:hypothetical protein
MIQPVFSASDLAVTKGSPATHTHVSEGSGKEIHINFCGTCGTKLFQTFERFAGAVGVYRGSLDDPNWIEITPENSRHIFTGTGQADTILPAHTPIFREHALFADGTAVEPMIFDVPRRLGDLS